MAKTLRLAALEAWKALGSMSFAVVILGIVATAASIGSFVEQNQPPATYVGDFGGERPAVPS